MSDTTFSPGDRVRHRFSNQPGTVLKVHVNNVDVRYDNSPERFITFADFLVRDLTTPNGDGKVHPRAHAFRTTASV
ncbi:MAG: hypothetical protein ACRDP6_14190, partial [Actinoallomurus sp.]